MSAGEDTTADTELRELIKEAVSHAVERRASLKRKEEELLDVLISDTSPTSPTAPKAVKEDEKARRVSRILAEHGPLAARLRNNYPQPTSRSRN